MNKRSILLIFVFLFLVISVNVNAVLTDDLVTYWSLDSYTGNVIIDSMNRFNGTGISGITNIPALISNGNNMTDVNAHWTASADIVRGRSIGTICYWLKHPTAIGSEYFVDYRRDTGGLLIYEETNLNFKFGGVTLDTGTDTLVDSNYHQYCWVYNGTTTIFYRDGLLNMSGSQVATMSNTADTLTWGKLSGGSNGQLGTYDEIGFWNRTITQAEITQLYNAGVGITYPFSAPDNRFNFTSPSESGTTKYIPQNYILVNYTLNISAHTNSTLYLYNSTGLYTSITTTNDTVFMNFTVPFTNDTYYYNVTARNTTNQSINSLTYTNYILLKNLTQYINITTNGENNTIKYLPNNYLVINLSVNTSNYPSMTNMTIYLYNSTGLYYSLTTTNTTQFINLTLPFTNETYRYNATIRRTDNEINSLTYTNYIRYAQLNVTVLNYTGGSPLGFNYSLTDLSTLITSSGSTTSNSTLINVVIGRTYNLTVFSSTLATTSVLVNINSSSNFVYITAYPYNSIRISSFLESDNSIISVNASLLFFGSSSSFTRTLNGTNNTYFPINDDTYTITVTSGGYATRSYVVTVSNSSTQSLNIYMLPSNSTSIIGIYTKDLSDNILANAVIQVQQLVNTTYLGIAQGVTDGNGFVTFALQEGRTYRLIISADNFNIFQINFVPYSANSPYTFKLSPSSTFVFNTLTDYIQYSYSPISQTLNSTNNTFTLTTYSANGSVIYTFINCSGRTQNVSNIPVGTTVSANLNVSEGQTVSCLYSFNVVDYGYYSFTVNYIRLEEYAQGIKASAQVIKNSTQQVWLTLLAYIIMTLTAMGIKSRYPDVRITGVIFTVGTIFFVALGWINFIAGGVSATIGLLLLYMGSR